MQRIYTNEKKLIVATLLRQSFRVTSQYKTSQKSNAKYHQPRYSQ